MEFNENNDLNMLFDNISKTLTEPVTYENILVLQSMFENVAEYIKNELPGHESIEKRLIKIVQNTVMHDLYFIYVCSFLLDIYMRGIYAELILEAVLYSDILGISTRLYMKYQIEATLFRKPEIINNKINELKIELYKSIEDEIRKNIHIQYIPEQERDSNKIIIMTSQFLTERHAPTHSTLERAKFLKRSGYDVEILSTLEGASDTGMINLYSSWYANYFKQYCDINMFAYGDETYNFYQISEDTNTLDGFEQLVNHISESKPLLVIFIGGKSIASEIVNDIVPVITVSTVFSTVPDTDTDYIITAGNVTNDIIQRVKGKIWQVPFTFELKQKKRDYSRQELGIPEDKFVMTIIGNRLDDDVTKEYIDIVSKVNNGYLLLIGKMETYNELCEKYEWLRKNSMCTGYCNDVAGVLECADLYVNSKRLGGGFSVVEAMNAGCPAVTLNYGDISVAAGNEFVVNTYDEMLSTIEKYRTDPDFYKTMQQKAYERVRYITNGEEIFINAINEIIDDINNK